MAASRPTASPSSQPDRRDLAGSAAAQRMAADLVRGLPPRRIAATTASAMRTISISISSPKRNARPPAEAKKPTRPPNRPVLPLDAAGCPDPGPDQVPFKTRPLSSGNEPDESEVLASVV